MFISTTNHRHFSRNRKLDISRRRSSERRRPLDEYNHLFDSLTDEQVENARDALRLAKQDAMRDMRNEGLWIIDIG